MAFGPASQVPHRGRRRRRWVRVLAPSAAAAALAAASYATVAVTVRTGALPQGQFQIGRPLGRGIATLLRCRVARQAAIDESVAIYDVTINKRSGDKLGMRLEHEVNGTELYVSSIADGFLCQRWNAENPSSAVTCGDMILEVNGVRGSPLLMREECKKDGSLNFRLRRMEGQFASDGKRPALISKNVMVAPSSIHGFGVFAAKDFSKGEVLHESPGRLVRGNTSKGGDLHELQDDVFELGWDVPDADQLSILGLGFASLHNHADPPNAEVMWERSKRHNGMIVGTFYALRPISRGEELFIHYGDRWWSDRANRTTPAAT